VLHLVGQLLILIKFVMFESVRHCHQNVIDCVQRRDFFYTIVGKIMAYFQKLLLIPVLIVLVVVMSLFVTPCSHVTVRNTREVCTGRVEFCLNVLK